MCGIVGIVGNGVVAPALVKGLEKLQYRGYDSAGIASVADGQIRIGKDVGSIPEVERRHRLSELPGNVGIGHVRWATHGKVTQQNAHPHLDCTREVAVVHNGIIENYREIRRRLEPRHAFVSQTDTEVIPHLIEEHMASGASLEEAVSRATGELQGSWALLAISTREPGKIVGSCKDEPLSVGTGKCGSFVASDVLSFLEETRRFIHVNDGELAVIDRDGPALFRPDGTRVTREPDNVQWDGDAATKQGYDFFMLKEIMEQPQSICRAVMQDRNSLMQLALDILKAKQVVFTACGSSRYAALLGRYIFSRLGKRFSDVIMASEFRYFADSVGKDTLVIAISQSGETADVLEGAKAAAKKGAMIVSVVNRVDSLLARASDRVLYLNCGPEIAVAATKSFVSQLAVLYVLGFAMADQLAEGTERMKAIAGLIETNINGNGRKITDLALQLRNETDCYYIGRGSNLHIALEGALKLKEIAYVHADGMPAGELKHGTLALIDKGTPVVAICPRDYAFHDTMSNVEEAKARGAFVIGVSDRRQEAFDEWIAIPEVEEIFYPLVSIAPLQLLAYHSAIVRGLDPDKPRNLAKSVTVK